MRATLLTFFTLLTIFLSAQAPALIPYQAIARDAAGQALNNVTINARFSIHDGSATGDVVWQEMQTVSTTALGLFTVQLGISVALTGVNWSTGSKFMQVEIDLGQGFTDIGTQQLLSVPYSLYSRSSGYATNAELANNGFAGVSASGDTLFLANGNFVIVPGVSLANNGGISGTTNHTCGASNVHNPDLIYGSMTDQEGNVYKTIVIGTQEWMAENLNTSIYRNGDAIPTGLSDAEWQNTINTFQGAWAYYNNDEGYACPYGKWYNWYACADARQLCPVGWHVPTDGEWSVLINYLLGESMAGGKMKTTRTIESEIGLWSSPNEGATNSSGFSGVPGGVWVGGSGSWFGYEGYWWSSTLRSAGWAGARLLGSYTDDALNGFSESVTYGLSVRCLRD
jgi:uncharacterized protein (TIGR02145 family)